VNKLTVNDFGIMIKFIQKSGLFSIKYKAVSLRGIHARGNFFSFATSLATMGNL
jgi:hypothetical protein